MKDLFVFASQLDAAPFVPLLSPRALIMTVRELPERVRGVELRHIYVSPWVGLGSREQGALLSRQRDPDGVFVYRDALAFSAALERETLTPKDA